MSSSFTDQPAPEPRKDFPADAPPPEPPADDLPKLGSLAQAARGKQLRQARGLLIGVGALTAVINALLLFAVPYQVNNLIDQEIRQQGLPGRAAVDPAVLNRVEQYLLTLNYAFTGSYVALGLIFIFFGLIVQKFPVPITVTSLILFLLVIIVSAFIEPWTLLQGWIIKIVFLVGIVKAIQAAIASERERRDWAETAGESGAPRTDIRL